MSKRLQGFSLPTVLVIAVLMALLVLFALSLVDLDRRDYDRYHVRKQHVLDLHSAAALYRADSTLLSASGDSVTVRLFGTPESEVSLSVRPWGLYEVLDVSSRFLPFGYTAICGKRLESRHEAALWVCDRRRPLSFAGNSVVEGCVFAPQSGVNYMEMDGVPFTGVPVQPSWMRVSIDRLPEVDSSAFLAAESMRERAREAWYHLNVAEGHVDYSEPTSFVYGKGTDRTFRLSGNRVLYGDELVIGPDSDLDGVLVFARTAVVEDGFRGRFQLFCTDSVTVRNNVSLLEPSGIFVSGHEHPYVSLGRKTKIEGYVIVLNQGREDQFLTYPCLHQADGGRIRGLVYVDGAACLEGTVEGAAYLGDCFSLKGGDTYPGVMFNVSVKRPEDLVYPLLLTGPYRRREICKVF